MSKSISKIILKNWLLQRRSIGGYFATNRIYRKSSLRIMSGPFTGLQYVENATGGAYFPKLLGTYEKELNPVFDELKKIEFRKITNVGGGEGYFAVGMARLFKDAQIIVYEPEFYGCYLIDKMAIQNNVRSRLSINARLCYPVDLQNTLQEKVPSLVVMDVEGAELELLNPVEVPGLLHAHIVVEIHDSVSPDLGTTIMKRFSDTHNLTEIWQQDRTLKDMPFKATILKGQFLKLMHEGRGSKMRWFYFKPK